MSTHTPGPWTAVRLLNDTAIAHESVGRLAQVHNTYTEVGLANAVLIAAAPDLLVAARDALAVARHPQGCSEEQYHAILDALDDAINQAEGTG